MDERSAGGFMNQNDRPLDGWRILLVEDQYLIAAEIRRLVQSMGGEAIGPANTVEKALGLLDPTPDFAILDINLGSHSVWPLVDALKERSVPLVLASGYDHFMVPDEHQDVARLRKPLSRIELARVVRQIRAAA
jgi:two-component SAPR family response regulator